jgi:hypothetical protein
MTARASLTHRLYHRQGFLPIAEGFTLYFGGTTLANARTYC